MLRGKTEDYFTWNWGFIGYSLTLAMDELTIEVDEEVPHDVNDVFEDDAVSVGEN